jgi:hypothetical protein
VELNLDRIAVGRISHSEHEGRPVWPADGLLPTPTPPPTVHSPDHTSCEVWPWSHAAENEGTRWCGFL